MRRRHRMLLRGPALIAACSVFVTGFTPDAKGRGGAGSAGTPPRPC